MVKMHKNNVLRLNLPELNQQRVRDVRRPGLSGQFTGNVCNVIDVQWRRQDFVTGGK